MSTNVASITQYHLISFIIIVTQTYITYCLLIVFVIFTYPNTFIYHFIFIYRTYNFDLNLLVNIFFICVFGYFSSFILIRLFFKCLLINIDITCQSQNITECVIFCNRKFNWFRLSINWNLTIGLNLIINQKF